MRDTLLGRTTLYLGALLFICQVLWFGTARYLLFAPLRPAYEKQIFDMVAMAQALIEKEPPGADLTSTQRLQLPPLQALEIVPDSQPRPELKPHDPGDFPGSLTEHLQKRFGPSGLSLQQKGIHINWLRFPARGQLFWLKLPTPDPTLPYSVLFLVGVGLALAVIGSYLIVFRLTKKLRRVTEAAKAVGQGESPGLLETTGPDEIRALSEGFNQMSRDLMKLDADRRLMLAGISHDLRTPLTRLRIATELMECKVEPTITSGMIHDIEDMNAILKQFLDYARDGSEEQPGEYDLEGLIQEIRERFSMRGHPFETDLGGVPPFAFRQHSMRRVLTNLVENAVRYGKIGVCVQTRFNPDTVFVTVSDQGAGIRSGAPEDFIKPFAREDASRSEPGTGLGLTIVDRVVSLHGGQFRLGNAPGGGLKATVELPFRSIDDSSRPSSPRNRLHPGS